MTICRVEHALWRSPTRRKRWGPCSRKYRGSSSRLVESLQVKKSSGSAGCSHLAAAGHASKGVSDRRLHDPVGDRGLVGDPARDEYAELETGGSRLRGKRGLGIVRDPY